MNREERNLKVFGYGLGLIAAVFGVWGVIKHGVGSAQVVLLCCSMVFTGITAVDFKSFEPAYRGWMAVAHVIGSAVTTVILGMIFVAIFIPVGLVLKLAGKDHLDRRFDASAVTYWIKRNDAAFSQEQYRRQF